MPLALAEVLAENKGGTVRDRPKEVGAQNYEPTVVKHEQGATHVEECLLRLSG